MDGTKKGFPSLSTKLLFQANPDTLGSLSGANVYGQVAFTDGRYESLLDGSRTRETR